MSASWRRGPAKLLGFIRSNESLNSFGFESFFSGDSFADMFVQKCRELLNCLEGRWDAIALFTLSCFQVGADQAIKSDPMGWILRTFAATS